MNPPRQSPLLGLLILLTASLPLACARHQPIARLSQPQAPLQFKTQLEPIARPASAPDAWWKIFNDTTLNHLQTQAIHSNLTLETALANLEESRAMLGIAQSDAYPSVQFSSSFDRTRISPNGSQNLLNNAPQSVDFPATRNRFRNSFDMAYELDLWGKIKNSKKAAKAQYASQIASINVLSLSLTADIARHYFSLRALDLEQDLAEQHLKLRRQAVVFLQDQLQAGLMPEAEVARAETEASLAEAERSEFRRRRAQIENAIAILCGQNPSQFHLQPHATPLSPPPSVPPGLPSELLSRRPDLIEAEQLAISSSSAIGVAKANFLPSIRLTGSAGLESVELKDLFLWESRAWSFGPNVSLPVFQGGRNRANLEIAEARYEQTVTQYRQRALVAFQEVEDSLKNIDEYTKQAKANERIVASTAKRASSIDQRFRAGLASFLDGVESQRAWIQARSSAIQVNLHLYEAQIQLIKALGGGFEPAIR